MVQPARPSVGLLAPAGFVTGGGFLQAPEIAPDISLPESSRLFGAGGLLGKKSREEQALLDAPDEFFAGDTKKEKDAARKKAIKAVQVRRAEEGENKGLEGLLGDALGLQGGGLQEPQPEEPGFFERLTRSGAPGGLLDIIGRTAFGPTEIERLENQTIRDRLTDERQRRSAQSQLTGLLTSEEQFDPRQAIGLLSEVAPEAVAQGLLGQAFPSAERSEPSTIRELRAVGIDPESAEGREIVVNRLKGSDVSDDLLRTVELQLKAFQLEAERAKIVERDETETKRIRTTKSALKSDLKNIVELADLNLALEGTSLQTGATFQDIRRSTAEGINEIMEVFGVDRSAARRIVSQRDAFNKLSNNFLIQSSSRFGGGTLTDQKLGTLRDSMAGVNITPDANRVILADSLDALLAAAEIEGITIENAKEIRERADKLRVGAGLLGDALSNIPGFDELSAAEQSELRGRLNAQ